MALVCIHITQQRSKSCTQHTVPLQISAQLVQWQVRELNSDVNLCRDQSHRDLNHMSCCKQVKFVRTVNKIMENGYNMLVML